MENCPTCGTCLIEHKPIKPSMTLQEWFDVTAAPEFKTTLLTIQEACDVLGWRFQDKPICCGEEIEIHSLLGDAYHGQCKKCGKWLHDITVQLGNSWVGFPPDSVDSNTLKRWIARVA